MLRRITAMEARKSFGEIMNLVNLKNEYFIVERNGKPLAAIVPLDTISYIGLNETTANGGILLKNDIKTEKYPVIKEKKEAPINESINESIHDMDESSGVSAVEEYSNFLSTDEFEDID
jgi:hypothetical protein